MGLTGAKKVGYTVVPTYVDDDVTIDIDDTITVTVDDEAVLIV